MRKTKAPKPTVDVGVDGIDASHRDVLAASDLEPEAVVAEIIVAACLTPLIVSYLALPVDREVQAVDASNERGAVVARKFGPEILHEQLQLSEMRGTRTRRARRRALEVVESPEVGPGDPVPCFADPLAVEPEPGGEEFWRLARVGR